jgi:hypothetical protein
LSRPNWSRRLPRSLIIPRVITLRTLGDVRELIERHLPAEYRQRDTWLYVANCLDKAACGGDPMDVVVALKLVFSMEGVKCRPR